LILAFGRLWRPDCVVEEQELGRLAHLASSDPHCAFLALHCGDRYGRWGADGASVEAATSAVVAYRRDMNVEYPLAFDLDMSITDRFGLEWFPTILILGDGVIRAATTDLRRRTPEAFFNEARVIQSEHQ
jgi:hypothetical protein